MKDKKRLLFKRIRSVLLSGVMLAAWLSVSTAALPENRTLPQAGDYTYSHANAVEAPTDWSFEKVSLADGSVSSMTWDPASGAWRASADGSSGDYWGFFSSGYSAGTADGYDIMAVYTAPVKAKVSIDIHLGQLQADSDGIILSASRNGLDTLLLPARLLTPADGEQHLILDAVLLNEDDRVYVRLNKNGSFAYDAGSSFSVKVTYQEINPAGSPSEGDETDETLPAAGDVEWLHENVLPDPKNWGFQAVSLADNSIVRLRWNTAQGVYELESDPYGYFGAGQNFGTANAYDMLAVYTAPVKVKLDLAIDFPNGFPVIDGSDGVIVSITRNSLDRYIMEPTAVGADGQQHLLTAESIVLNEGDQLYIRINKNQSQAYDVGSGMTVKLTYQEIKPADFPTAAVKAGDVSYSHANAVERPYDWSFEKVSLADGSISSMVWDPANGAWRASADGSSGDFYGYFQNNYSAGTADGYDIMAVFQAPAKVKVDIDVHLGALPVESDGIAVSVMRNELNRFLKEAQLITSADGEQHILLNDVILNQGDKVYTRLNKNISNAYDAGVGFSVKVTYKEINPAGDAAEGTVIDPNLPRPGDVSYSHANAVEAPTDWSFEKVSLADGSVSSMIWDAATASWRASSDTSSNDYYGYFLNNYSAGTAEGYDIMAVYTAPVKAKISLDIHIANLQANSNGVIVSAARNELNRMLLFGTVVIPADGEQHLTANEIVLEEGDKLYVRLGANGDIAYDAGMSFSARVTYQEIKPEDAASPGTVLLSEQPIQKGAVSISTDSIGEENGRNGWNFSYITAAGKAYPMVYNQETASFGIPNANENNSYAGFSRFGSSGGTAQDYDSAIIYQAPVNAKVRFTLTAKVSHPQSDGILVKILRNSLDNRVAPVDARHRLVTAAGGTVTLQTTLELGKGEWVYFLMNKNGNHYYDQTNFFVTAEYLECYDAPPGGAQTPPDTTEHLYPIEPDRDAEPDLGPIVDGQGGGIVTTGANDFAAPAAILGIAGLCAATGMLLALKKKKYRPKQ